MRRHRLVVMTVEDVPWMAVLDVMIAANMSALGAKQT